MVDDLDNGSQATSRRTLLDQDNTADLDDGPVRSGDADVTHFRGLYCVEKILIRNEGSPIFFSWVLWSSKLLTVLVLEEWEG